MKIEITLGDGKGATSVLIGVLAAILAIVGSIGPWASAISIFGTIEVNGTSGDGKIILALAIAALFWLVRYLVAENATTGTLVWITILFAAMFAIAAYDAYNLTQIVNTDSSDVALDVGWGLTMVWISTLVGTVDLAVASFNSWRQEVRPTSQTVSSPAWGSSIQSERQRTAYSDWLKSQ